MSDSRFEAPVAVDLRTVFVGMGVLVTAATIPSEAGGLLAGQTGIMFHFGVPGYADDHVRVFIPAEAVPPQLVEMVTEAAADVVDEAVMEQIAAVARAANLASGLLPGGEPVFCRGCGLRLFGEIAVRGACLTCEPETQP